MVGVVSVIGVPGQCVHSVYQLGYLSRRTREREGEGAHVYSMHSDNQTLLQLDVFCFADFAKYFNPRVRLCKVKQSVTTN